LCLLCGTLRSQLRGLARTFLGSFPRGLLRGKFAPPYFIRSGFGCGLRLSFLLCAQPLLFNGLFRALPGFLANLCARGREVAVLATVQISPGI
jgi:hypothetical protein